MKTAVLNKIRILLIEDNHGDVRLIREMLAEATSPQFSLKHSGNLSDGLNSLSKNTYDVILLDINLPDNNGLDLILEIKKVAPMTPIVMLTGLDDEKTATSALQLGAQDYLVKGRIESSLLVRSLRYAIERKQIEKELLEHKNYLEDRVKERTNELVSINKKLVQEIKRRIETEVDRDRIYAAAESAPDAIVITDVTGKIQYMNPAFERITGFSRDETAVHDLHVLDNGSHNEAIYPVIREAMKQGQVWNGLLISKRKDGILYHEDCTISPTKDPSGKIINYVSVRRDITDKLRLESIAEAINTMNNIGYVFSGIRHEIGNPINSIKMTLTVLRANMDNYSKEAVQNYIERMQDEVLKIEYLLKSLKAFNMYETPELQDIRLPDFLEKFLALSKNDYEQKGITITASVEPGTEFCHADPRALQQVLLNIFTNAIDACVAVPTPEISIVVSKSSGKIHLQISDNGCGMTGEQQNNLFKPFYTTKSDGTGLGLVIAKKMLTKMNACMEVKSRLNEGTKVCIIIPEGSSGNCTI